MGRSADSRQRQIKETHQLISGTRIGRENWLQSRTSIVQKLKSMAVETINNPDAGGSGNSSDAFQCNGDHGGMRKEQWLLV